MLKYLTIQIILLNTVPIGHDIIISLLYYDSAYVGNILYPNLESIYGINKKKKEKELKTALSQDR